MNFECRCKFLNKELKTSKKGNQYLVVTIMQDSSVLTIISDVDINLDFGEDCIVVLTYDVNYKNIRLTGIK